MYGNNILGRGISFIRVLNGISKTLNVANQLIPMYQKAKPVVNNARSILNILKNINIVDNNNTVNNFQIEKKELKQISSNNNPVFFI